MVICFKVLRLRNKKNADSISSVTSRLSRVCSYQPTHQTKEQLNFFLVHEKNDPQPA